MSDHVKIWRAITGQSNTNARMAPVSRSDRLKVSWIVKVSEGGRWLHVHCWFVTDSAEALALYPDWWLARWLTVNFTGKRDSGVMLTLHFYFCQSYNSQQLDFCKKTCSVSPGCEAVTFHPFLHKRNHSVGVSKKILYIQPDFHNLMASFVNNDWYYCLLYLL